MVASNLSWLLPKPSLLTSPCFTRIPRFRYAVPRLRFGNCLRTLSNTHFAVGWLFVSRRTSIIRSRCLLVRVRSTIPCQHPSRGWLFGIVTDCTTGRLNSIRDTECQCVLPEDAAAPPVGDERRAIHSTVSRALPAVQERYQVALSLQKSVVRESFLE